MPGGSPAPGRGRSGGTRAGHRRPPREVPSVPRAAAGGAAAHPPDLRGGRRVGRHHRAERWRRCRAGTGRGGLVINDVVAAARAEPAQDELIEHLRALIRIPSVSGDEIGAARHVADVLATEGLAAEVLEPEPRRGSVVARLPGAGSGGGPLLLMSHLDVVPAPAERWTHDPFGGEVVDGYVWGRGAIDMKHTVAMELQLMLLLARQARAAGRDPARDPVPGLRRDVVYAATADEEIGGGAGTGWIVAPPPPRPRAHP